MRHLKRIGVVLALLAAACGGGDTDDSGSGGEGDNPTTSAAREATSDPSILSPDFNLDDLPNDFGRELVPPSWTAGQATDILGPFAVNFESDMAFADAVAHYDGILGPSSVVGDPGEQLAQWLDDPTWIVSIFDGDPVLIGFVQLEE